MGNSSKKNLLNLLEEVIKRPLLAELVKTNETYLCVLAQKEELTGDMEERLRDAGKQAIKKLEKAIK